VFLQDYLQQAREGDPLHPAARTPYHFTFYLYAEEPPTQEEAGEHARAACVVSTGWHRHP
jgi:hypothetical protein